MDSGVPASRFHILCQWNLRIPDSKVQDYGFHCIYFAIPRVNYVHVKFLVDVNRVNEFAI